MKGNKNGCPLCGNKMRALHKSFTYDQIIGMCKEKYGDYYTYPESNRDIYKTKQSKIQIICPKHGMFEKRVQKFLGADQECPKCKIERTILNGYVPGGYNHDWFNKHPDQKSHIGILYYLKLLIKLIIKYSIKQVYLRKKLLSIGYVHYVHLLYVILILYQILKYYIINNMNFIRHFVQNKKFYRNIKILENIQHILQSYLQTIFMNI